MNRTPLLAGLIGCALTCALTSRQAEAQPSSVADTSSRYRLAPGDAIDIKLPYNPEFNESTVVRPDGVIALQLIGEMQVSGLTPLEAERRVREAYKRHLVNPDTTIIVREFANQQAYVGGEVGNPGALPLRTRMTSLAAISYAGGARSSAKLDSVLLIRHVADGHAEVRRLNLTRVLKGRDPDVTLQPFDVVYVPRSAIAKIGLFVDQYIRALVPTNLVFPYNLNSQITVREQ
jgi:protein involved in polysaccharide export with SLBB domain